MNRILTYGVATMMVTVLTPSVFADKGKDKDKKDKGGGGSVSMSAASHVSQPKSQFKSQPKATVMSAPSAPRVAKKEQMQFRSEPIAQAKTKTDFKPKATRPEKNAPSIAFGGRTVDNSSPTRRSFSTAPSTQQFTTRRGDTRDFRVPFETSRSWDRGRVHEWNNHRFHYYDGAWVIIDPGIYDYGYPDEYATTYSSPAYDDSLVMSAQDRLNRLGYSAGPVDGVMGRQTRDAIADFQSDNGLPATGRLDTRTVRQLGL